MSIVSRMLEEAWKKRADFLESYGALRIFHGPAEGTGEPELSRIAIEYFRGSNKEAYVWVFSWESSGRLALSPALVVELSAFLQKIGVRGAVLLERPEKGAPEDAKLLFGEVPEFIDIHERDRRYRIRFLKTKHPGLFLDHAPLRDELASGLLSEKSVLNTFAYTGSLSVAARKGGAERVVTLDLSKPTVQWAEENWALNFGDPANDPSADFIYGDVFEWLPRLIKRGEKYDCVILDPPSFSRSPKKVFSTARDLGGLHALAIQLVKPSGILITSINSAKISRAQFREQIQEAEKSEKRHCVELLALGAPKNSFPGADYLKGWIFRVE